MPQINPMKYRLAAASQSETFHEFLSFFDEFGASYPGRVTLLAQFTPEVCRSFAPWEWPVVEHQLGWIDLKIFLKVLTSAEFSRSTCQYFLFLGISTERKLSR